MINGKNVLLREKKLTDARDDYDWETDPELAQLDAAPVIAITFSQYLADYAGELTQPIPTSQRFAIDTLSGTHIGNCSYYNIRQSRGEAELGVMIGNRDYWDKGYGTDAIASLVDYIFDQTNLNRIYLTTLESNTRAQKCFQKCGFTPYGHLNKDGYSFMLMEIYRHQWQKQKTTT